MQLGTNNEKKTNLQWKPMKIIEILGLENSQSMEICGFFGTQCVKGYPLMKSHIYGVETLAWFL